MQATQKRLSIIPHAAVYYNRQTNILTGLEQNRGAELDLKEICVFLATGFFLGDATYYKHVKALRPGTDYSVDENGKIVDLKKYWEWIYEPRDISLQQATEEYASLFEKVVAGQTKGQKIILPLSGGLDSRTLAVALPKGTAVEGYSYEFAGSFPETKYGKMIADACGFPFHKYIIPRGYLWDHIEDAARLNKCCAELTHARQVAVADDVSKYGDTFLLGHWGDVFFDDMGLKGSPGPEEQIEITLKKIVKKGGKELGRAAWQAWGLDGSFDDYLKDRVSALLSEIKIDHPDAKVRAFKSMHWVYRWTSTNLVFFSNQRRMELPYYSDEMARFITTVPEEHLAARKIQIEYLKAKSRAVASIPWQVYDPLNLYNYHKFWSAQMIPVRAMKKISRVVKEKLKRTPTVERNWEIQFLGEDNENKLKKYLFDNEAFSQLIPQALAKDFYTKFREVDSVYYSHSVSMLLTLSLFSKLEKNG